MTAIGLCSGFVLMKDHPVVFLYGKDKDGQNLPKTAETVRRPAFPRPPSPLRPIAQQTTQTSSRWGAAGKPYRGDRPDRPGGGQVAARWWPQ